MGSNSRRSFNPARFDKYLKEKKEHIAEMKKDLEDRKMVNITFAPEINAKSVQMLDPVVEVNSGNAAGGKTKKKKVKLSKYISI